MTTALLDIFTGISGDMKMAALYTMLLMCCCIVNLDHGFGDVYRARLIK